MTEPLDNPATPDDELDPIEPEQEPEEVSEDDLAGEDDEGYEPDTATEFDEADPADLPPGDSGDFDGGSIDEDEAPGEAQPDEPMTREEAP